MRLITTFDTEQLFKNDEELKIEFCNSVVVCSRDGEVIKTTTEVLECD